MNILTNSILVLWLLFSGIGATGQILNPVTWDFTSKPLENNEVELQFTATIDEGWHMYSQFLSNDDGPIATSFEFEPAGFYKLSGKTNEPKPHTEFDPNFNMDLNWFEKSVTFKQVVTVSEKGTLKGELTFMVCDANKCLPPEYVEFSFPLNKIKINKDEAVIPEKNENTDPSSSNTEESGILDPVKWDYEVKSLGSNEYELLFSATIDPGWHIYSVQLPEEDGPIPTSFAFTMDSSFVLVNSVKEQSDVIVHFDQNFGMELSYFENTAVFSQKVKVFEPTKINGELTYMTCDDQKCLPPEYVEFSLDITDAKTIDKDAIQNNDIEADLKKKADKRSLWTIFFVAFLSGFAALLTPCVFPMIPMTVSFFTKQSKTKAAGIRNAVIYGISIIVIYVVLGTVVTGIFGSDALNALSTNIWFNIFFFVMLIVFAISFMGAFEITLPSSWVNKADQASDKGGMIGIFFMAFTLALVSFSCTGPIVGTLLFEAASIGGSGPVVGMTGFSLALALPFALFAAFPGWLNTLPKSGGWLNTVKVFLGFLELALAFKFLSNADLVVQAHFLEREVFIAIWIAVFFALALYLFGFISLPHDSPMERIGVGRALMGILTLTFVIYLIPGMWGAPLKLISGFPPPMSYSESPLGVGREGSEGGIDVHGPEGAHRGPQGIWAFDDYDKGVAYAKKIGKPAFLDFTGHACVNCRKMEQFVWGEPGVIDIMKNEVVLISLYVDDKRELPIAEQKTVEIAGKTKKLRSIGNKWSYLQALNYKTNTQPYYIMLGPEGEDLSNASADYEHHGNKEDFLSWLKEGLKEYKEKRGKE